MPFAFKKHAPNGEAIAPDAAPQGFIEHQIQRAVEAAMTAPAIAQAVAQTTQFVAGLQASLVRIEERLDRIERVMRIEQSGGRLIGMIEAKRDG